MPDGLVQEGCVEHTREREPLVSAPCDEVLRRRAGEGEHEGAGVAGGWERPTRRTRRASVAELLGELSHRKRSALPCTGHSPLLGRQQVGQRRRQVVRVREIVHRTLLELAAAPLEELV